MERNSADDKTHLDTGHLAAIHDRPSACVQALSDHGAYRSKSTWPYHVRGIGCLNSLRVPVGKDATGRCRRRRDLAEAVLETGTTSDSSCEADLSAVRGRRTRPKGP